MILSLKKFLREGRISNVQLGLSWAEIVGCWGDPDSASKMSLGKNSPFILKYGCIELHLDKKKDCFLIFLDYESCRNQLNFPEGAVVEDWDINCGFTKKEVTELMKTWDFPSEDVENSKVLRVQESKVNFGFDDADVVSSIYLM